MDQIVPVFLHGVHNLITPENIPQDAAQDAQNFVTIDGKTVLVGGRITLGASQGVGGTQGFAQVNRVDGTSLLFVKRGTKIQYWDGSSWHDCITGLSASDQYTMQPYTSLAGAFLFINGAGGYWKVVLANPGSPIDLYDSTKNFKGYILIDKGRTLLWNRDTDKTGLYGSYIDAQDSTVYTTVSGEAVGVSGSTTYSGTLAFKGGHAKANCFGIQIQGNTGSGTETFTDNFNGVLTSNFGGTGTINYATGAYSVTFAHVTTGSVTANYQWEDSTQKGIADFSKSGVRTAGQGFVFRQDKGGDPILNVLVGQDGSYYSLKQRSAYVLSLSADDLTADNNIYREQMGLPYFRAAISTSKGIFFINTNNPSKPEMTILQKSKIGNFVEPLVLFPQFKFANYLYDQASFDSYDRFIIVHCRTPNSAVNDTMLMCNLAQKSVDIVSYTGNMGIQDGSTYYVADSVTGNVYSTFDGFDDLGSPINAFWISRDNVLSIRGSGRGRVFILPDDLKKVRRLRWKGHIGINQAVQIYASYDEQGFQLLGTIRGDADYVNVDDRLPIGSHYIGETDIGGEGTTDAYGYYMELRLHPIKFRKITLKIVPTGIGYFDFEQFTLWDILKFENRMPKLNRQKQKVSIDGKLTNQ